MHERNALALSLWFIVALAPACAADLAHGWGGASGVSWRWIAPDTSKGLKPNQSWRATASAPDGYVYVASMNRSTLDQA
jgi:hypothetical protein